MTLLDQFSPSRMLQMAFLAVLGLVVILLETLPLGLSAQSLPSPDLLLCVIAYWSIRRPESAPAILIFILALVRDLLTDIPVGAGVLTLLIVSEALKLRRRRFARANFAVEWIAVALAAIASAALHWLLVVLMLAQPPYLSDLLNQSIYTMMCYPLLALFFRWGLQISWKRTETV